MNLIQQSAVNCTAPQGARSIGLLCCLDAAGMWLDGGWCAFRESAIGPSDPMRSHLNLWSQCLARAAWDNATLADILAEAGQGCFVAPGSISSTRVAFYFGGGILGVLILMVLVICLLGWYFDCK